MPGHLAVLGSLFDFAGPGVSRKFRLFLFRVLGGALAADFYLYRSETQRLRALLIGLVSGALCQVKIHDLENLPKGGFLLLPNHTTGFDAVAPAGRFRGADEFLAAGRGDRGAKDGDRIVADRVTFRAVLVAR